VSLYGRRVDSSQAAIKATLERLGWVVRDLSHAGRGVPDLLVASAQTGRTAVIECKVPGGRGKRLRESQEAWRAGWPGEYVVMRTPEDALAWGLAQRRAGEGR
jgi:hypothetical protein